MKTALTLMAIFLSFSTAAQAVELVSMKKCVSGAKTKCTDLDAPANISCSFKALSASNGIGDSEFKIKADLPAAKIKNKTLKAYIIYASGKYVDGGVYKRIGFKKRKLIGEWSGVVRSKTKAGKWNIKVEKFYYYDHKQKNAFTEYHCR